jgi:hypothetical protein
MSLIEGAPSAVTAAEHRDGSPQRRGRVINVFMTAVGMAGIAAITMGWAAVLVRAAIWLFWH